VLKIHFIKRRITLLKQKQYLEIQNR